ncbi:SusC/RagA family TonB-linked outer membrane protein [Chryseobacterium taklimakanense]|uniref:SusC/RagA family TonB-linked outer membrane protein n=1 Tax=Chryseobacterium taklimakanense TaxID=536441 RepID=UPI000F602D83|nr:SusC/RagA family TonB-linked outer membrane protein [Chryseobacterium taklimakanense]AZI23484.1 SusC/RagA family TonB-linked outer membrane protein [Chryseobacterium taklimakanense]
MKKLTTSVLAVVLASSFTLVNAQVDTTRTQDIEGVVVTALGIKREKKSIGYAAQEVKGENISEAGQTNALSALSGNVAGVQVTAPSSMGGSTRITMRGISSLTGENRPLIIVDGVPLDNTNINNVDTQRGAGGRDYGDPAFDINPDDIESVTVLKGGPAAALYGSRASNGVIIYTTKSARRGRASVELNTGISFENIYIYPQLQRYYGGGLSDTFEKITVNGRTYNIADYGMDESWGPKYDPNLMYLPWNAFDPEFAADYMKEIPWVAPKHDVDSFFETGITLTNNISVSKSFDKSNLRVSYTNTDISGILPNSSIKKNNFSINANSQLSDKFKVETVLNFVQTHGFNRPEQGYGDNSVAQKFFQWGQRQLDFSKLKDYKLANGMQRSWNRTAWNDATPLYSDNPYWTVYENIATDKRNRFFGNVGMTYNILDNLYVVGKLYADIYAQNNESRVAIGSQSIPDFTIFNRNNSEYNYEARVHWNPRLSDDFTLNTFVGANRRQSRYYDLTGSTVGGLIIPNFYNLNNSVETAEADNYEWRKRVNSVFGSASLGYRDTFFLEATARNDWFSTVAEDQFYPSITGSFVFSNLIKQPWLSFGKLRAGWANVASDTNPFLLANYVDQLSNFNGDPRYLLQNRYNDPLLRPELKDTKEIGLEMSFMKNRFGFDVTYYNVDVTDGILPLAVDPASGYPNLMINAGQMTNKGWEATAFAIPVKTSDFNWEINWNFTQNENKVVKLHEDAKTLQLTNAPFRARLLAIEGQPYGQIYGTDFTYHENGQKIVTNSGNGYVPSAITSLGSTLPDYNMGLRNTFRYKDLRLSFLFDMQKGGKYFSTSHMWGMYSGMIEESALGGNREAGIVLPGVKADGTANTTVISAQRYGAMHYNTVDALNVFDASYIKLRDITLSYDLPKSLIGGVVEGVRLSAFGRNLFAWGLDWKGMDPENTSYGSGNIQGLEGGSLPSTRQYGVNVNIKF